MLFTRDQFERIKESEVYKNSIFKNLAYKGFNKLLDEHKIEDLIFKIAREINKLNDKLPSEGLNVSVYELILKININSNKERLLNVLDLNEKQVGILLELEKIIDKNFNFDVEKMYLPTIQEHSEKEEKIDNKVFLISIIILFVIIGILMIYKNPLNSIEKKTSIKYKKTIDINKSDLKYENEKNITYNNDNNSSNLNHKRENNETFRKNK